MMENERHADKIRDLLKHLIGQRLLEITEADEDERKDGRDNFVELMFEKCDTVRFFMAPNHAYRGRSPISFSDPDEKDDQFEDGYFCPTPEEEAIGGWVAVDWRDATGTERHIVPVKGKHHWLDGNCWCNPDRHFYPDGHSDWRHNEAEA
jgi:hypothetical protein